MSSAIYDLPKEKDYGLGFNYSVWTQGTAITLCNVPWNSDYRDIVRFNSPAALDNYLQNSSGPVIDITRVSYAKFGKPIRLDTPFHTVQNYNYIRVFNPAQPIKGDTARAYYYFIVDVVYVNPNCTEIYVQLDVWQTFGYGVKFGNCYIQQGHIGIANTASFTNFGRDYLTVPEGLDMGNEYEIYQQYSISIAGARDGEPDFEILVVSTVALDEDAGTVDAPKLTSAEGSSMENLPNGAEIYLFNSVEHFQSFMAVMKDKPWITQGIVSIQAVPPMGRYGVSLNGKSIQGIAVSQVAGGSLRRPYSNLRSNWRNDIDFGRYANLKKFLTYPYTVLEMTSYSGTPLVLKPECLQSPDLGIVEVPHIAPPNARIAFYPYRYNASSNYQSFSDDKGVINDGGEFLDMVTGIMDFPAFSIVNNGYMQFMASNQAGIAYQHASADWSQQRALQGAATGYDQASAGINNTNEQNRLSMNAAQQQTNLQVQTSAYQGMQAAANSFVDGFATLNPLTAVRGTANAAVSHAIGANQANTGLAISNNTAAASNQSTVNTAAYMRDTNKSLADWSANGDYQNAIAGINARVQDAKLTQPTTAGQMGGNAFNLATYRWGVDVKVKRLTPAFMNAIGEYWLRYGYAINRFGRMPDDFLVMEKFTYWKLKETYITASNCPESFKQVIRGIFEKGVTVWRNPNDIGNVDIADNAPLQGVSF